MRRLLSPLYLALLLIISLVIFLGETTAGLNFVLQTAAPLLPGKLTIKSSQGELLGTMQLADINYENNTQVTHIQALTLTWQPLALLTNTLHIQNLIAKNIQVKIKNTDSKSTTLHIKKIPLQIIADTVSLQDFSLLQNEKELVNIQELQAHGSNENLQLKLLNAKTLNGEINGVGNLHWQTTLSWQAQLTGKNINPGIQWPAWPGQLNFSLANRGEFINEEINTTLTLQQLSGKLRGYPLIAAADMQWQDKQLNVQKFTLNIANSKISLAGKLDKQWNMAWDISIPNLIDILPHSSGNFFSKGTIAGEKFFPIIKADINANNLSYSHYKIQRLEGNANVNLKAQEDSQLDLQASAIRINKLLIQTIKVHGSSHAGKQLLQASVHAEQGQIDLQMRGQIQKNIWQASIEQLNLISKKFSRWQLKAPTPLQLSTTKSQINAFCWQEKSASICGQGSWEKDHAWSLVLNTNAIELSRFKELFPAGLSVQDKLSLQLIAHQDTPSAKIQADLSAKLSPGTISYTAAKKSNSLVIHGGELLGKLTNDGLSANLKLLVANQAPWQASFTAPGFSSFTNQAQPINGKLSLQFNNLEILPNFISDIKNSHGLLSANLALHGTVGEPRVTGAIKLENGYAEISSLGIDLKNINLAITGNPSGTINYLGSLVSGAGTLHLQGNTSLANSGFPSNFTLRGSNIQVMQTQEAKITMSPDLKIQSSGKDISITGNLLIPEARITPQDFRNVVTMPDDVIYVNQPPQKPNLLQQIAASLRLNVTLGENIYFEYIGLQTNLAGNVIITKTPNSLANATGELYVTKGIYNAYGQKLTIAQGKLIYTGGNLENPGLSIRATREINTVGLSSSSSFSPSQSDTTTSLTPVYTGTQQLTVGVAIDGTVQHPVVSLFANPEGLSQGDILSYLVLGYPQNQASAKDAVTLLRAASAMNVGTSKLDQLTQQIQKTFGLRELNVQSTQMFDTKTNSVTANTALVIGKQLAPKLYLRYSVGLFNPLYVINLRYELSKRWAVQSENSTIDNGGDILYTIERK